MVTFYNASKKSVDQLDQMASYRSPLRKSIKWYRKVAFELLLNTSVINAHIVYNKVINTNVNIQDFRKCIILYLTNCNELIKRNENSKDIKKIGHKLLKAQGTSRNRGMCKSCYHRLKDKFSRKEALNKAKKVMIYCVECGDQPILLPGVLQQRQ